MPIIRTHKPRPSYLQPVAVPKDFPHFEPLPAPDRPNVSLPLSAVLDQAAIAAIQQAGKLAFHSVGDTGGVNGTGVQELVAEAMEAQVTPAGAPAAAPAGGAAAADDNAPAPPAPGAPAFFYHLGDVIYYNGQSDLYHDQFYEPYKFYPPPIFAVPGNHDGNPRPGPNDPPDPEPSLFGFVHTVCDVQRHHVDNYRDTMTQPYVYWTLEAPFVTIVGLYGNVDGLLDGPGTVTQQTWLRDQLKAADPNTCLVVAVHQPPYSLDASHGGYRPILDALDQAARDAGRWPDAVFSGHVHNYQRFTRHLTLDGQARDIPYLVAGAGGYANTPQGLHRMNRDGGRHGPPVPCPVQTADPEVELRGYNEVDAGFLRATADATTLTIEYFAVPLQGAPAGQPFDSVTLEHTTHRVQREAIPGIAGAAP